MKRKILKLIAPLLTILILVSACNGAISGSSPEKAPEFSLPATDGTTISLADFKGRPVFINFWEVT